MKPKHYTSITLLVVYTWFYIPVFRRNHVGLINLKGGKQYDPLSQEGDSEQEEEEDEEQKGEEDEEQTGEEDFEVIIQIPPL